MLVEKNVPLQSSNTFGIVAKALTLVRVAQRSRYCRRAGQTRHWRAAPKFVLGGGSNIVLTGDVKPLVLKVEIMGKRLVGETAKAWIVEAGAGENWHELVTWTLEQRLSRPGKPGADSRHGRAPRRCRTSAPTASSCRTASSRSTPWT